jgi:hypothetical protein
VVPAVGAERDERDLLEAVLVADGDHPRVVDEDVDPSEPIDHAPDHVLDRRAVGEVRGVSLGRGAGVAELPRPVMDPAGRRAERERGAFACKDARRCEPDPGG